MSRRTRRVMILGAVLLVVMGVIYFALPGPPGSRITPAAVRTIAPGMTRAEVESLLGAPPGIYGPDVTVESLPEALVVGRDRPGRGYHWVGRRAAVFVIFDADGRVVERYPLAVQPMENRAWWEK